MGSGARSVGVGVWGPDGDRGSAGQIGQGPKGVGVRLGVREQGLDWGQGEWGPDWGQGSGKWGPDWRGRGTGGSREPDWGGGAGTRWGVGEDGASRGPDGRIISRHPLGAVWHEKH